MSNRDERTKAERVLELSMMIVYIAYLIWVFVPSHTRRLYAMKALYGLERAAGNLAKAAGRQAMRRELAGDPPGYELPTILSKVRDWARGRYTGLRPPGVS